MLPDHLDMTPSFPRRWSLRQIRRSSELSWRTVEIYSPDLGGGQLEADRGNGPLSCGFWRRTCHEQLSAFLNLGCQVPAPPCQLASAWS